MNDYQQQKQDFLDNLQPDDFRNGGSFNQAETIIDQLNNALHQAVISKKDPEEFINKAVSNLFREDSLARDGAIKLFRGYLKIRGV